MKLQTIRYLDGDMAFRVPKHWKTHYDPEDGGCYWDEESEGGETLRVSQLVIEQRDASTVPDLRSFVGEKPREGRVVVVAPRLLENGCAMSLTRSESVEDDGATSMIHRWLIASEPKAGCIRLAIFTFAYDRDCAGDASVQAALESLDQEIPRTIFAVVVDEPRWEHEEVEQDGHTVPMRHHSLDEPLEQRIEDLDREELAEVAAAAQSGEAFVRDELKLGPTVPVGFAEMDAAFAKWLGSRRKDRPAPEAVPPMLGACFGELCRRELGLAWCRVIDHYGETLAITTARRDFMAFPVAAIEKRVEDRESGFLENLYLLLRNRLEEVGHQ